MKKHGFTLAEVLITLGIIGVVSALVIPTFTAQTQNAKIGPRVGKAISSFEQATKAIMEDAGADTLSGATVNVDGTDYALANTTSAIDVNFIRALSTHMKGGSDNIEFLSADGFIYKVDTVGTIAKQNSSHHNQYIQKMCIDINGDGEPNKDGRDKFYFAVMDDGSLLPFGSSGTAYNGLTEARTHYWYDSSNGCRQNQKPNNIGAKFCAGHIVENGMKVYYK